jgi:hypothetical protein
MDEKPKSLLELYFYRFLKGGEKQIDLNGFILTPTFNAEEQRIIWIPSNPNKLSFAKYTLTSHVEKPLFKFSNMIYAPDFFADVVARQQIDVVQKLFISPKDYDIFMDELKKMELFSFENFEFKTKVLNLEIKNNGYDEMDFYVDFEISDPINPETDEKITFTELSERMYGLNEDDSFVDKIDNWFLQFFDFLLKERPSLVCRDTIASFYPNFLMKNGRPIKYW